MGRPLPHDQTMITNTVFNAHKRRFLFQPPILISKILILISKILILTILISTILISMILISTILISTIQIPDSVRHDV
jgi:hypothetical protein